MSKDLTKIILATPQYGFFTCFSCVLPNSFSAFRAAFQHSLEASKYRGSGGERGVSGEGGGWLSKPSQMLMVIAFSSSSARLAAARSVGRYASSFPNDCRLGRKEGEEGVGRVEWVRS